MELLHLLLLAAQRACEQLSRLEDSEVRHVALVSRVLNDLAEREAARRGP
jgi:hypothetical protein